MRQLKKNWQNLDYKAPNIQPAKFYLTRCLIFSIAMSSLFSCKDNEKTYLFLSHTRTDSNPKIDSIAEKIDYSQFDMLWLGGDIAWYTSADDATMEYVDEIFDLSDENTLWAIGNHDYFSAERIQRFTKRPNSYSYFKNGITYLVLNTQDSASNITTEQLQLLSNIKDTIKYSSHLILLHHKLIWMYGSPDLEELIDSVSNASLDTSAHSLNPNNFYDDVYPLLLAIKQNGIEVLCIGGDIGGKVSRFEYHTSDDIVFLASGIDSKINNNKALLFKHDITGAQLTWEYRAIISFLD